MGLDQWLHAREYISGTNHRRTPEGDFISEENPKYIDVVVGAGLTTDDVDTDYPSATVEIKVAQWRKAWQIHTWFVNEIQDGEDNCKDYYVSRDKLIDLRNLCQQVLDNPESADELLPDPYASVGDDPEWYTYQMTHTITQLDKVLNNTKFDGWDFQYSSSW
jgi:hypothetical protein